MSTYTIQKAAQLTGLTAHTIRAWEKRYHAVVPSRTAHNRRYYNPDDILKLNLLKLAVEQGQRISKAAALSVDELKRLTNSVIDGTSVSAPIPVTDTPTPVPALSKPELFLNQCITYIEEFDPIPLENLLVKAYAELDSTTLINKLVVPLINEIGIRWYNGSLGIASEHMAAAMLTGFIQNLRNVYNNYQSGPPLITACPAGQQHELGALLVALSAASLGWRVIHLGANLPAADIIAAVNKINPGVLALSLVYTHSTAQTTDDLVLISESVSPLVNIIIGGRSAADYKEIIDQKHMMLIQDLNAFKLKLNEIKGIIEMMDKSH